MNTNSNIVFTFTAKRKLVGKLFETTYKDPFSDEKNIARYIITDITFDETFNSFNLELFSLSNTFLNKINRYVLKKKELNELIDAGQFKDYDVTNRIINTT